MKSFWVRTAVIGVVLAGTFLITSCGPKMATPETLSRLEECRAAVSSAQDRISKLEQEIQQLQAEIDDLKAQIPALEQERDSLRNWLNLLEQGY